MRERPMGIQIVCLILLGNIAYLFFCWFAPQLCARLISSDWPLLIKWSTLEFVGGITGGLESKYLLPILLLWQVVTLFGVWFMHRWARRSLLYTLLLMIVWGTISFELSRGAAQDTQIYAERSYNGFIRDHYFEPIKVKWLSAIGRNEDAAELARSLSRPAFQYEPICWPARRFDIRAAFRGRTRNTYEPAERAYCRMTSPNSKSCVGSSACYVPDTASLKDAEGAEYWPYWTLYRVSRDANDLRVWMGEIVWRMLGVFVFLWFVFVPACTLYYVTDPRTMALFGGEDSDDGVQRKRIPFWLFVLLVVLCSRINVELFHSLGGYYLLFLIVTLSLLFLTCLTWRAKSFSKVVSVIAKVVLGLLWVLLIYGSCGVMLLSSRMSLDYGRTSNNALEGVERDANYPYIGFWKGKCDDDYGLLIEKANAGEYYVRFCMAKGCFKKSMMAKTRLVGDPRYRIFDIDRIGMIAQKEAQEQAKEWKMDVEDGYLIYKRCSQ